MSLGICVVIVCLIGFTTLITLIVKAESKWEQECRELMIEMEEFDGKIGRDD